MMRACAMSNEAQDNGILLGSILIEEGILVPFGEDDTASHDANYDDEYILSPAFARVLAVSGVGNEYRYTFRQISRAVGQFCHDCDDTRKGLIRGVVVAILDMTQPERMRHAISEMHGLVRDGRAMSIRGAGYDALVRGESDKRHMR